MMMRIAAWRGPAKRWMHATSKQKRALSKDQLGASQESTPPPPTPTPSPPASESSNLAPLMGLGLVAIGGITYYALQGQEQEKALPVVAKEEPKAAPKVEEKKKAEESTALSTNKVTSIDVPSKMKNTAASTTVSTQEHPAQGNRVAALPSAEPSKPIEEDTHVMDRSIAALHKQQISQQAAESLVQAHQSALAVDLDGLDERGAEQLRVRVVQLAKELQDRTKWEAVRLKEFLTMKEQETANRYLEKMQQQRLDQEELSAKLLREKNAETWEEANKKIQEKEAALQQLVDNARKIQKEEHDEAMKHFQEITTAEIHTEVAKEFTEKYEQFTAAMNDQLAEKVSTVEALTERLAEVEKALQATLDSKAGSLRAHRLSAAALALAEKLETSSSAVAEIDALQVAAGNTDGVIATALATLPTRGVPTLSELQARFVSASKEAREAALVPSGRTGLEGQIVGKVFATLKYEPNPNEAAPEADKDSAEYVLVRAKKHVELGELDKAVEQVEKLKGQARFTLKDWKTDALQRIAVEKALRVIKMECALLNESLVEE